MKLSAQYLNLVLTSLVFLLADFYTGKVSNIDQDSRFLKLVKFTSEVYYLEIFLEEIVLVTKADTLHWLL
jgi:hypothetical protein